MKIEEGSVCYFSVKYMKDSNCRNRRGSNKEKNKRLWEWDESWIKWVGRFKLTILKSANSDSDSIQRVNQQFETRKWIDLKSIRA